MKKLFIVLLLCLFPLYSQSIDQYFLEFRNIEIVQAESVIQIIDKNEYQSSSEAMESVNRILTALNLAEFQVSVKYNNSKFSFEINKEWINTYFSDSTSLLIKSRMLSSLVTSTLEKYRTFNK